jgi:thiamine kinase-like enzyme
MLSVEIEALCSAIVPGEGRPQIFDLSVGLVNRSYRVSRDGVDFVLRVATDNPSKIGLNLSWEARVLRAAADARLAPAVHFCDPQRGVLLSAWIIGGFWPQRDLQQPARVAQLARLLRTVHALPVPDPPHTMSPSRWIRHYDDAGCLLREELRARANAHLGRLAELTHPAAVVCHGDLHSLNLLETSEGALRLLDWEYAHVSEPLWDLAGWCANGEFTPGAVQALLSSYFNRAPRDDERIRMTLLRWLYDYICLQWSTLYLSRMRGTAAEVARISEQAALLDARLSLPAH